MVKSSLCQGMEEEEEGEEKKEKKKKNSGEMWPRNYTKAPSGYMQSLHTNEGLVPVGC